jgi:ABC-type transporter MlaC component
MMYDDQKLQLKQKLGFSAKIILILILFAFLSGVSTSNFVASALLAKSSLPSYLQDYAAFFIGITGFIITTIVSKVGVEEVVDKLINEEIDARVNITINHKQEVVDGSIDQQKNIFGNIGLEYISILYKVLGKSWLGTEPYRLFSKSWRERFIELTETDVENFYTKRLAANEAVQILLKANEKLDILDGYSILQTISNQSVLNECNRKISLKTKEEQEELYRVVLITLSAWLICCIKYQVKIPPVEILGKYMGDNKDYLAALEFIKEEGLTAMYRNLPDDISSGMSSKSKELISECIDYLIKDLKIDILSNKGKNSRKSV